MLVYDSLVGFVCQRTLFTHLFHSKIIPYLHHSDTCFPRTFSQLLTHSNEDFFYLSFGVPHAKIFLCTYSELFTRSHQQFSLLHFWTCSLAHTKKSCTFSVYDSLVGFVCLRTLLAHLFHSKIILHHREAQ